MDAIALLQDALSSLHLAPMSVFWSIESSTASGFFQYIAGQKTCSQNMCCEGLAVTPSIIQRQVGSLAR